MRFRHRYFFLSNFSPSVIRMRGEEYATAEHAYQAAKTVVEAEREAIRLAPTPGKAKRLGKTVTLRPGWSGMKRTVMLAIVTQKFNHSARRAMLESVDSIDGLLVESAAVMGDAASRERDLFLDYDSTRDDYAALFAETRQKRKELQQKLLAAHLDFKSQSTAEEWDVGR